MSTPSTTSLCLTCRKITISSLQSQGGYQHHASLPDLEVSAKHCNLCTLIILAIRKNIGLDSDEVLELSVAREAKGLPGLDFRQIGLTQAKSILHIDTRDEPYVKGIGIGRLRIFSQHDSIAETAGIVSGHIIRHEACSDNTYTRVRSWLWNCLQNHERCRPYAASNPELPTRVLDLRGHENIRLLETGGTHGQYIALSHCWGKVRLLTTTKKTVHDRYREIMMNELPQTFKDAVLICRELGVFYLWIDSLCIVQDDEADWIREAERMGSVYANSYCTIAATSARNSAEGILGNRITAPPVELQDYDCENVSFCLSLCGDVQQDVNSEPLNQRAWVLQERILSPRTLHYTSHQVFWECFTLTEPEDGSMTFIDRKHNFLPDFGPGDITLDSIPDSWYYLIEEYSRLDMTFPKDKLVAISGLVNRLQSRVTSSYHYGLWSLEVRKGLFWLPADKKVKAVTKWRSPSWSWAAYDGQIQYYQNAVWPEVTIEMKVLELPKPPITAVGVTSDATLVIQTKVRELTNIGLIIPKEELVPIFLDEYTECYKLLGADGEKVGWISLDETSDPPNVQRQSILCALVSSCEINNNPFGNKFLFAPESEFFVARDFASEENQVMLDKDIVDNEWKGEVEPSLVESKQVDDENQDQDEEEDETNHLDQGADIGEGELDDYDYAEDDNSGPDMIISCYFLALESVKSASNGRFKRVGMGVLTDRSWIDAGMITKISIQ